MKPTCIDVRSDLHKLIIRLNLMQWPLRSQRCIAPILLQLANIQNRLMASELLSEVLVYRQLRLILSQTVTKFTKQAEEFLESNSLATSRKQSQLFVRKEVPETISNIRSSTTAIAPNKRSSKEKVTDEDIKKSIIGIIKDIQTNLEESAQIITTFELLRRQNGTYNDDISIDEVIKQWQTCQQKFKLSQELLQNHPDLSQQHKTLRNRYNSDLVIMALQHYQSWESTVAKLLNHLSITLQRLVSEEAIEQNYFSKSSVAQESNLVRKSLLTTMIQDQISEQKENSMISACSPVKIISSKPLKQKTHHHRNHQNRENKKSICSDIGKPANKNKQKKPVAKVQQCAACALF